jgi:uncharacterized protein YfbU (UPF0304 family)
LKLSKLERLILSNQYRILEKLDPEEAKYYEQSRKAIEKGYTLHYDDLTEMFHDELSEEACEEVINILSMYSALIFSFKSLKDKNGIDEDDIKFRGFDGNDSVEAKMMGYAKYFMNDLDRFDGLRDNSKFPNYNSHCPMLNSYRRMLDVWGICSNKNELSKEDIIRIIEA